MVFAFELGEGQRAIIKMVRVVNGGIDFEFFQQVLGLLLGQPAHYRRSLVTKNPALEVVPQHRIAKLGKSFCH